MANLVPDARGVQVKVQVLPANSLQMNLGWYKSSPFPKLAIDQQELPVYFVANG